MNMGKQGSDDKIWSVGTNYKLGKLKVGAMYLQGDNDVVDAYGGSDWGTVYSLRYGASDKKKTGSWGAFYAILQSRCRNRHQSSDVW